MRVPRRELLLSGAALLAGCSALGGEQTPTPTPPDGDDDGVPDRADDYPDDPRRAFTSSSSEGIVELAPGEFSAHQLQNDDTAGGSYLSYEVSVVDDATVDVLVFERAAYDAYQSGARDVSVVDEYTRQNVSETALVERLDDRALLLALDNTDQQTPATDDPIEVEFELAIAEPPGAPAETTTTE
ncbi:hypothetical protein ACAH01_11305 [Halomicrobium sp. HM KBTZ05]|uniref:hypothetical protein n=1 Tax=Halomicrobium sp. HM KBTZ05 TaxID=3242663 RepID=UPI00355845DF